MPHPDTATPPPTCNGTGCPPTEELRALVHGDLDRSAADVVTDHVGDCPACQQRMEELATGNQPALSVVCRHIDRAEPPKDSAYWRALNSVEGSLTLTFGGNGDKTPADAPDLKLTFLRPAVTPGRIGVLSTFEVEKMIGRGGMGVVLQAFDPCLERDVAVKILDPQLADNKTARERFCREARAAASVSHDNLVAVHQVDEDEHSGLPFLVMQLVTGESLEQRLRRVGKLTPTEVARIGAQAAAGLTAAHAAGLIHRDIKPGNILLEAGGDKVKLTDFGLARAAEDMKLTRTGFVAGTPLYMAPEQARGDDIDARADLFSLGSVLYEALAGRPPFEGKTPLAVLRRVADEAHRPLHEVNPDVPDWLEDVIDRLLAKEPADRFQSAAEVADVLSARLAPHPSGELSADPCGLARSSARWSRRAKYLPCWKKVAAAAATFGLGAAVGGLGVWGLAMPVRPPGHVEMLGPEPMAVFPARSGAIWSLALSADGKTLVMGIENGRISLWDVATQRLKYDLHPDKNEQAPAHKGPVWALDFTPDDRQLVSASDDGTIKVWDAATGKQVKSIPVGTPVRTAAVSPNGSWVGIGDRFGGVTVFDLAEEKVVLRYQQESTVNGVAFSPDNKTVASVSTDGSVAVWEVPGQRKRFSLTGHTGPVYGLSFAPGGRQLATASWDQTVILWDLDTGTQVRKLEAHDEGVWAVRYSPDGRLIAAAGQDGTTKLWDPDTGDERMTFGRHKGTVHTAEFDDSGRVLATGGRDGTVRLWDVSTLRK